MSDKHFASVVALLQFDGTDGATTFTDVIGNTWTASGNAQIDTASSKWGGASGLFDGNNDYLRATSADFNLGTGDYTIEFWASRNGNTAAGASANAFLLDARAADSDSNILIGVTGSSVSPALAFYIFLNGTNRITSPDNAFSGADWRHCAVCRASSTARLFIDGAQVSSNYSSSENHSSTTWTIGGRYAATGGDYRSWNGWLDSFRATKGVARYTANFTPPQGPFAEAKRLGLTGQRAQPVVLIS